MNRFLSCAICILIILSVTACAANFPTDDYDPTIVDGGSSELPERYYTPFHNETDTFYVYDLDTKYTSSDNPSATLFFSDGSWLTFELYPQLAPESVKRFIDLVNNLFIEGSSIHSIEQNYLLCGGAIGYNNVGIPYFLDVSEYENIAAECTANGYQNDLPHLFGVIGFCLEDDNYNSVGTQFYVCLDTLSAFDGYSPAFGRIKGDESYDMLLHLNSFLTTAYDSSLPDLPQEELTFVYAKIDYGNYAFLGE